jgi:hypothetical protein
MDDSRLDRGTMRDNEFGFSIEDAEIRDRYGHARGGTFDWRHLSGIEKFSAVVGFMPMQDFDRDVPKIHIYGARLI